MHVEDLARFLKDSQRMTTPKFSPNPFGALMDFCWVQEPVERPGFPHLKEVLKNIMEISAQHYYLELNNEEYICSWIHAVDGQFFPKLYRINSLDI